ncbi:MAG: hypothetical protein LBE76_08825 [Nitrososphaerota archaeon]|jgi:hypothetical protein|nr:hypothetical protein [Nitrososphaerota archaeon]
MGAPTSSILSRIYMQYLENTVVYDILRNFKIEGYFRYVDDILILYKDNVTNIKDVINSFNSINPELKFSMGQETDNKLNFLDITIVKDKNGLTYEIYRKPTTSDTIILKDSCHPIEQKLAAIRYFANRIHTYDLDDIQKQKEIDTVKDIICNNKYESILQKVRKRNGQRRTPDEEEQKQNTKM